jgi:hypothetical protein
LCVRRQIFGIRIALKLYRLRFDAKRMSSGRIRLTIVPNPRRYISKNSEE